MKTLLFGLISRILKKMTLSPSLSRANRAIDATTNDILDLPTPHYIQFSKEGKAKKQCKFKI